jgi:hypothetical protein
MSETLKVAFVAGITNVVAIVVSRWISSKEHNETQRVVAKIDMSINGRLDELLKLTAKSAHAEGVRQQKETKS